LSQLRRARQLVCRSTSVSVCVASPAGSAEQQAVCDVVCSCANGHHHAAHHERPSALTNTAPRALRTATTRAAQHRREHRALRKYVSGNQRTQGRTTPQLGTAQVRCVNGERKGWHKTPTVRECLAAPAWCMWRAGVPVASTLASTQAAECRSFNLPKQRQIVQHTSAAGARSTAASMPSGAPRGRRTRARGQPHRATGVSAPSVPSLLRQPASAAAARLPLWQLSGNSISFVCPPLLQGGMCSSPRSVANSTHTAARTPQHAPSSSSAVAAHAPEKPHSQ
jgi:hypothetical protein